MDPVCSYLNKTILTILLSISHIQEILCCFLFHSVTQSLFFAFYKIVLIYKSEASRKNITIRTNLFMYRLKILATRNINFIIYLLARSFLFSLGVQRARNYIDVALCKCTIYAGHYFMPCGPIYIFFIICPLFYESVHVLQLLFIQNFMAFFFFFLYNIYNYW